MLHLRKDSPFWPRDGIAIGVSCADRKGEGGLEAYERVGKLQKGGGDSPRESTGRREIYEFQIREQYEPSGTDHRRRIQLHSNEGNGSTRNNKRQ